MDIWTITGPGPDRLYKAYRFHLCATGSYPTGDSISASNLSCMRSMLAQLGCTTQICRAPGEHDTAIAALVVESWI